MVGLLAFGPPPDDMPLIYNGTEAQPCQYPSVVAMLDSGTVFCSGTLIDPEHVLFAAHCIVDSGWTATHVGFGEDGFNPVRQVAVEECQPHPAYDDIDGFADLAWCRLAESVDDVPIVPLIHGCEGQEVGPGREVTVVGFGSDFAVWDGDQPLPEGIGPKRFTQLTIEEVALDASDLYLVGEDTSPCFGDSGGPAFIQMEDGNYRLVGVASQLHPDTQPIEGENICYYGAIYDVLHGHFGWLEQSTGRDLTPCFDTNGQWSPNENCREFDRSPALVDDWPTCEHDLQDWSQTCGAPFPDHDFIDFGPPMSDTGEEEESTTDDPDEGGDEGTTLDPDEGGDEGTTVDPDEGGEETTTGPDPDTGAGDVTSGDPPIDDPSLVGRGCGCSTGTTDGGRPAPWWLAAGAIFTLARRRRRLRG